MQRSSFYLGLAIFGIALFFAGDLLATTGQGGDFGTEAIISQADRIKTFLFGPVAKVAGVLGGGYGLLMSVLSSSPRPLIVFGGIGLVVHLIPKFIDGVYTVSGMLLP